MAGKSGDLFYFMAVVRLFMSALSRGDYISFSRLNDIISLEDKQVSRCNKNLK